MFKLVASDLDGTLLTPEHTIAPFTREVLQRLHEQSKHFIFATGRHHIDVASIREIVGIPAYMITSNGARVHDESGNLLLSRSIDPALVQTLVDLAKNDEQVSVNLYLDDKWLINRIDERLNEYHVDSHFSCETLDTENPPTQDVCKIFYTCFDPEHLLQYEKKLHEQFGDAINVAFSTTFCLEVMAKGISKGSAISMVAKAKGYSLEHCIAFGDGMNDVEMLQSVKKGVVMGNAPDRVKTTLANLEVIGTNEEQAVAHYLAKHLL
ncbi:MAG: Cof-type HAD-IIB family hydrolase [Enterovibrio sp.]